MRHHPALYSKRFARASHGSDHNGLFVKSGHSVKKGEYLWTCTDLLALESTSNAGSGETFVDTDVNLASPRALSHHNCVANAGFLGDDVIVALQDIGPHTQIVYDYAFAHTEESDFAGDKCPCQASACRGTLDFVQYKDPIFLAHHYSHCTSLVKAKMRQSDFVRALWNDEVASLMQQPLLASPAPSADVTGGYGRLFSPLPTRATSSVTSLDLQSFPSPLDTSSPGNTTSFFTMAAMKLQLDVIASPSDESLPFSPLSHEATTGTLNDSRVEGPFMSPGARSNVVSPLPPPENFQVAANNKIM